jgi:hypothetical protein
MVLFNSKLYCTFGYRNCFSCQTIKQFILFFILGLRKRVYTLNKSTHNIHLIPLLHKDETYTSIIISCEFEILNPKTWFVNFF